MTEVPYPPIGVRPSWQDLDLEEEPASGVLETFGAAFRLTNPVLNMFQVIDRGLRPETTEPNLDFNVKGWLEDYDRRHGTDYWGSMGEHFIGDWSEAEALTTMAKLNREMRDRQTIQRAGWLGLGANFVAAMADPAVFLPVVGPGLKGARAARSALAWGGVAGVAAEAPLQLNQELREWEEGALNVALTTLLSGILGTAVSALRPGEMAAMVEAIKADARGGVVGGAPGSKIEGGIPPTGGAMAPVAGAGAQAVGVGLGRVGPVATGARTISKILDTNPVTQNAVLAVVRQTEPSGMFPEVVPYMTALFTPRVRLSSQQAGFVARPGGDVWTRSRSQAESYLGDFQKTISDAYIRYIYDGAATPRVLPNLRAHTAGMLRNGKLSYTKFLNEAGFHAWSDQRHENPYIQEVVDKYRSIVTAVKKLADEQQLLAEAGEGKDLVYGTRLWDAFKIKTDSYAFLKFFREQLTAKYMDQYIKARDRLAKRKALTDAQLEDMGRPKGEAEALYAKTQEQLRQYDKNVMPMRVFLIEDQIRAYRAIMRGMKRWDDIRVMKEARVWGFQTADFDTMAEVRDAWKKKARQRINELKEQGGDELQTARQEKTALRRRLRALSKSYALLDKKQDAILDRIEAEEQASLTSLDRLVRRGRKLLNELDTLTDARLDVELQKLNAELERVAQSERRLLKRAEKAAQKDDVVKYDDALTKLTTLQTERLESLVERISRVEPANRPATRQAISDLLDESIRATSSLEMRRGVRVQKLWERAAELDPAQAGVRMAEIKAKQIEREAAFDDFVRVRLGAEGVLAGTDTPDFRARVQEDASRLKSVLMKEAGRLPAVRLALSREPGRGPELARALTWISSREAAPWLNHNIGDMMTAYLYTLLPDIELKKLFGDVDGGEFLNQFSQRVDEKIAALGERVHVNKKTGERTPWTKEEIQREGARINEAARVVRENFMAVIGRIRGTHGMPEDPTALSYRLGKTLMEANVLRLMGRVVVAAMPDPFRVMMRARLRTFLPRVMLPVIMGLKKEGMLRKASLETQAAGTGLEAVNGNMRAQVLFELQRSFGLGSKLERVVEFASRKMGIIALFSIWTDMWKRVAGLGAINKMLDALKTVEKMGFGPAGEVAAQQARNKWEREAITFLAERNLDGPLLARIAANLKTDEGGTVVEGVRFPNTEAWDFEAQQAWRQALFGEVESTIVSPGPDRAPWMDKTQLAKIVLQFKGFPIYSTQAVLMAGLQRRDAATFIGLMGMLALGMMSYYVHAKMVGGDMEKEMEEAGWEKWFDEAYQRAGILGMFGELQRFLERIPLTQPYSSFSGGRTTSRGGEDVWDVVAGPTSDFIMTGLDVAAGIHEPTKYTVHAMRMLMPYQNLLGVSKIFDAIERVVDAPEKRE